MSTLGRYLELSVRTTDIIDSLGFYKLLGFTELEIGDVWSHKYAVISDGVLCIGLHDKDFEELVAAIEKLSKERRTLLKTDL